MPGTASGCFKNVTQTPNFLVFAENFSVFAENFSVFAEGVSVFAENVSVMLGGARWG
jgi:hypothetical protein